jgi:hypothetical protein
MECQMLLWCTTLFIDSWSTSVWLAVAPCILFCHVHCGWVIIELACNSCWDGDALDAMEVQINGLICACGPLNYSRTSNQTSKEVERSTQTHTHTLPCTVTEARGQSFSMQIKSYPIFITCQSLIGRWSCDNTEPSTGTFIICTGTQVCLICL